MTKPLYPTSFRLRSITIKQINYLCEEYGLNKSALIMYLVASEWTAEQERKNHPNTLKTGELIKLDTTPPQSSQGDS